MKIKSYVSVPLPPARNSLRNGKLKDTPANQALRPQISYRSFAEAPLARQAFFTDQYSMIFHAEVKGALQALIDRHAMVDCIVTSPPYYGQRDYEIENQIGMEEHPEEYLRRLVEVFDLCMKILRPTGSLWINIGDTYWSGKGAHKSSEKKQGARRFGLRPQDRPGDGKWTKPKQLLLLPHRLAIALQDSGWLVRNDNVWVKPNPIPDQVRDRCSISHEYVFHFTKSRWYYFNREVVARKTSEGRLLPPLDTWEIKPANGNGSHKASFSKELVRIPILSTTPPNGIVLDPFNGIGTSMIFARENGFRSIGIDLSLEYCKEAATSLQQTNFPLRRT